MTTLWYATYQLTDGQQVIAANETGVVFVGAPQAGLTELARFFKDVKLMPDEAGLTTQAAEQLAEYNRGTRQFFSVATDVITGTRLQQQVWQALRQIGYGKTVSYAQLAARVTKPTAVRAVASAVAKNPLMQIVPCHRVVRSDGSVGQFRGGNAMKQRLLLLEKTGTPQERATDR